MYSSLDSIDVVATEPQTGRTTHHQTDHREPAEIDQQPELATLMALTRILNAHAMLPDGQTDVEVFYVCSHRPPEFLRNVVASAGGVLKVGDDFVAYDGALADVNTLAEQAFAALAEKVAKRMSSPVDEALLLQLEKLVGNEKPDRKEDEIAYWTRVLELAAVGGEVIRQREDGKWVQSKTNMAVVPFSFKISGTHTANILGRAERFIDHGEGHAVSKLLEVLEETLRPADEGTPMLSFKPGDYDMGDESAGWPLIAHKGEHAAHVPIAVACFDRPNSIQWFRKESMTDPEEHRKKALESLAGIHVDVEETTIKGTHVLVVSGSFYAAEKVLDVAFMRGLADRLGATELLAVGLPYKGVLLAMNAMDAKFVSTIFFGLCEARYRDPGEALPLTPLPFLVQDGAVVGFVSRNDADAQKKKPFWARWFGWN